jgi:hypothetical protein
VVVYALSDPAFLASIPDLPGGDPGTLDGVAFPVAAEPGKPALWSLLDRLDDADLDDAARNQVIRDWIGLGTRQLARRAGRLLLLTFDPAALPTALDSTTSVSGWWSSSDVMSPMAASRPT